jgi:hypothetical protein
MPALNRDNAYLAAELEEFREWRKTKEQQVWGEPKQAFGDEPSF